MPEEYRAKGEANRVKLNHLRDVLAVAEAGSLRAAGRQLGIAQPAITRSIREIEAELGISLFERNAKGVRVTVMGAAFIRRAEAIRSEMQRARDEIAQLKGAGTGEVSVALSTASSMALLPGVMPPFRKRYPDALLKISESLFRPIESDLVDGTIDFYVGPLDPKAASSALEIEQLFETRRWVFCRPGHPLADARDFTDLADASWVRPTLSGASSDADFEGIFADAGLPPPRVVIHARSALVTMLAIANSDMLTILPQQWLEFTATAQLMAAVPIERPMFAPPVCIVRRRGLPLTPVAEYLCDLMRRSGGHYAQRQAAGQRR